LLEQGWTQTQIAQTLERDAHTIDAQIKAFRQRGTPGIQHDQRAYPAFVALPHFA
jgi:hypothetical protein